MTIDRTDQTPACMYFNLTNACNSKCMFCASGSPTIILKRDIPLDRICAAFAHYGLKKGDEVILNGGEPTVCTDLPAIIRSATERHAKVILFTNGRLLRRYAYAKTLLEAAPFRISIPVYGRSAHIHDSLTGRRGSHAQTVLGIHNTFAVRSTLGYPQEIELKLLAVRQSLPEWPGIVELIHEEFGIPDVLLISGLHMWSKATPQYGTSLLPTKAELQIAVNQTLDRAAIFNMPTTLWAVPLCLLRSEHLSRYIYRSSKTSSGVPNGTYYVYFDPDYPYGIELRCDDVPDRSQSSPQCKDCELLHYCGPGRVFLDILPA